VNQNKYAYKAFISYARDPDKPIAKMLEDKIERFGINWHRMGKQKLYIFRDITGLVPDKSLPHKIESALNNSEFLIILVQEKFSRPDFSWVNIEAENFIKSCIERGDDPADFIILVVTKGDIEWDRDKNQWDFNITNVLPQSLRNIFKHEPIYADLRILHNKSATKSLKNQVFRDTIIAIVAKLLYKKPSEIQNQIIRLQRYAIGFIAIILVFISVLSVFAIIQKEKAVENEKEAKRQEQIAVENEEEAKKQKNIAVENADEAKRQEQIAVVNADEAKRQEQIAVVNEAEAKKQKNIAVENEEEAQKQRNIAVKNEAEAKKQEAIAITEKAKTDTINKLIEAENLALKSLDFFKSLDDTLVSNSSIEIDSSARNYSDSISKAFTLFNKYDGIQKEVHRNKLEPLYTSNIKSYIFLTQSKFKLDTLFDMIYQTPEDKTVVFNLNGQVFDIDSKKRVNYSIKNFVEATPVFGTNLILYSDYNKNINLLDMNKEKPYQIEIPNLMEKDVITRAFKENSNTLILNSKKGATYEIQFNENQKTYLPQLVSNKSKLITNERGKMYNISYYDGELKIASNADTTKIKVSAYGTDDYSGSLFWGNSAGEVKERKLFDKDQEYTIASMKDRINKILFDQNNQILIVQVGANQVAMFYKMEWGFTKIYQETIGKRINDICLGKNGLVYVLYDRNRLVYWPTQSILSQLQPERIANQ
jgi:hypothetical protein